MCTARIGEETPEAQTLLIRAMPDVKHEITLSHQENTACITSKSPEEDLKALHITFSECLTKDPNSDVAVMAASAACPRRERWAE